MLGDRPVRLILKHQVVSSASLLNGNVTQSAEARCPDESCYGRGRYVVAAMCFSFPMLLQTDLLCQLDLETIRPLSARQRRSCFSHGDGAESNLTSITAWFDGCNLACLLECEQCIDDILLLELQNTDPGSVRNLPCSRANASMQWPPDILDSSMDACP